MARICILICFLLMALSALSQKQDNTWLLGSAPFNIIEFTDGSYAVSQLDSYEVFHRFGRTNASLSDSSGNLEIYVNGQLIFNAEGDVVGIDSLFNQGFVAETWSGYSYGALNGAMFLPFNDTLVSLLTIYADTLTINGKLTSPSTEIRNTVLVKRGDSFDIKEKEILLNQDSLNNDGFAACKHANGRDWWVVNTEINGCVNLYLNSPESGYMVSKNCEYADIDTLVFGNNIFNQDGNRLAIGNGYYGVNIFDFDRCSGELSNLVQIPRNLIDTVGNINNRFEGNIAFSPNGRFLYVATVATLWQFDLESTDVIGSRILIDQNPGPPFTYSFGNNMRIAPNGNIYVGTTSGFNHWHIIHDPDSHGLTCNLELEVLLPFSTFTPLPNFPNYRLGPLIGSPCDTLNNDTTTIDDLHSLAIEEKYKLYPNPTTQFFRAEYGNFFWNSTDALSIVITNTLGQLVLETNVPKYSLYQDYNVSQWDSGLYWVSLYNNGVFVGVRKLVVE